ncbi:glycoside-pentoside-hexuronide (GPH):cation symporter [Faecalicatena sp. AGMB00832]|uniref:Glycoside-pentoside-hexuronide (GPH):cation symporter n=1 Tax=Faecalicatena faecalis TaxID=2726362 RepID=A0ABS6D070_9FIRM|nr:glycoside-pentoside-hexuronide (GPH):cation symporter [Faecalicatena faecalis]MBU3874919.1 glycoside-pentoside-hexuronide (GPH):cation symporter [Faecalicatena faecalis]
MSKRNVDLSPDAKVGILEHLAYGIGGGFATNAVNLFISAFLLIFYTEVMHVNPGAAASIIGISKLLDGLSDLVAGRIIDKTHSRFGKTRIWLLRMIPATIIALLLIYLMPSSLTGAAQLVYIFITYNLASTVCYTLTYVAYMTLNGLMTRNQTSRGLNGGINMVGNVIAGLVGNATIITLLHALSDNPSYSAYGDRSGWVKLLIIWMTVGAVAQLIVVFGTRERVKEGAQATDDSAKETKKETKKADIPFWVTMKALVKNKYWIYNIIICLSINFLMGATGSTTAYYMTYVVGDTAFFQIFSTVNTLSMLAAMLAGFGVMAKFGKRNAVLGGLTIRAIGSLLPLFSSSKGILIVTGVAGGIGYGIAGCAFASMIQDVLTYGEWKNGFSMIGMGNAANSFCNKVGNSLGTIVLGWIMSLSGYVAGAATQTPAAVTGLRVMFIGLPVIFSTISAIAAWLYDLDKIYPKIAADLKEGKYAPGVVAYEEKNK